MTRHFLKVLILALTVLPAAWGSLRADETNAAPDFREVYDLLRAHLPGATDVKLNRAAVEGLLAQFPGEVWLAGGAAESGTNSAVSKAAVLEGNVAYFRVGRVTGNLPDALSAANRALTATNKVVGAVLDLRFADGADVAAAPTVAKFVKAHFHPLMILVNRETTGAAESLAAALRAADAGLILGTAPAGGTAHFKEFKLSDGEQLCIKTPVNGDSTVSAAGLEPDIAINVSAKAERAFWKNPYGGVARSETNAVVPTNTWLPVIDHTSEADLVRAKIKDGDGSENFAPPPAVKPLPPAIRDPVLARAVDLIKGLAIVRQEP
jgi:Peptidase family S41